MSCRALVGSEHESLLSPRTSSMHLSPRPNPQLCKATEYETSALPVAICSGATSAIDLSGTHVTDDGILRLRLPPTEFALRIAGLQLKDDTIRAQILK